MQCDHCLCLLRNRHGLPRPYGHAHGYIGDVLYHELAWNTPIGSVSLVISGGQSIVVEAGHANPASVSHEAALDALTEALADSCGLE